MSALRINYKKSEVIILGACKEESSQIARWVNYRGIFASEVSRCASE
jgi:hypothetical protein